MKWFALVLLVALLLLQYRLWLSNDGIREVIRLKESVAAQRAANAQFLERNQQLAAEVRDLKQGYAALEERARAELGMISGNETFYQLVPHTPAGAASEPTGAPAAQTPQRTAAARD